MVLQPRDPAAQSRAAVLAGAMAARGQVDGPALLAAIRRAAFAAAPWMDRRGLSMRLAHGFADARHATALARAIAGQRVGAALRPLLDARAPAAALLAAAEAADHAGALEAEERQAMVADAIRARLGRPRLERGA